jgi:GT2 family glycosyltransferase
MDPETSRIDSDVKLLVSVLIVSYNGRKYIEDCLASVMDQELPRDQYEVVVVDNASSDKTPELIESRFPSVRLIRLDRNYGPNTALRMARPHLKGKYVAYANQDVVAHRRWLPELLDVAMSHPRAGIVESNMILPQWPEYNPELRDVPVQRAYVCDLTPLSIQDFRIVPVTPTTPPIPVLSAYCAACIINPQVLDKLEYWTDEGFFAYFDDIDLGLRLNAAGYEVLVAPRSLVYHDTIWLFQWSWRSVRRAFLSTRNMILVYYKLCYPSEFMRLLPKLFMGKLLRAGQHKPSLLGKVAYALAAMPLLLVSMIAAVLKMPAYHDLRVLTMSRRITPSGWLVDSLRNLDWGADRAVWADRRKTATERGGL